VLVIASLPWQGYKEERVKETHKATTQKIDILPQQAIEMELKQFEILFLLKSVGQTWKWNVIRRKHAI
jgi:hypothetical protein